MKQLLILPLCFLFLHLNGQTVLNPGSGDSLFPVFNRYLEYPNGWNHQVYTGGAVVSGITKANGKYYMAGNFNSVGPNHGSALVVDTLSGNIINNQQWRVNGLVHAAIPDGQGGFYIAGEFTKVGDSIRKYIAQIDATGAPRPFRPAADTVVKALFKRNDTLFIAGAFKNFAGKPRSCFAMYSTSGDSLCTNGGIQAFTFMETINTILVSNDTLIYGGKSINTNVVKNIMKYNFKNNVNLPWGFAFTDYTEVSHMALSADSTVLVYGGYYNGEYIKGVSNIFGNQLYFINISMYWPESWTTGALKGMKVHGNKGYITGWFEHIRESSGAQYNRKGFFAFNPNTGAILPETLTLDWYASFLEARNGKLYISGKFKTVNGVPRERFAVLDTGTLALNPWQLAPTDALTALAFAGNKAFVGGHFRGLNSVSRSGFAAFDSATKALLPWNPVNTNIETTKRMMVKGDSLFILGWTTMLHHNSCFVNNPTVFRIISLSTGADYNNPLATTYMDDCVVDGNYLYVSSNRKLRRYILPNLVMDAGWGYDWAWQTGYDHNPVYLVVEENRIFSFGDTRFVFNCNSFGPKRTYMAQYNKATGVKTSVYYFEGLSNIYDQPMIENAVRSGNKMYVSGSFNSLNNNPRKNFACLDITTGAVTPWQPVFANTATNQSFFDYTKKMQVHGSRIWITSYSQTLNDGSPFYGFGGIDTLTADLVQPLEAKWYPSGWNGISDFLLSDNELTVAGGFDSINQKAFGGFVHFKLPGNSTPVNICAGGNTSFAAGIAGNSYQWQVNSGNGFVAISDNSNYIGSTTASLQLVNVPATFHGYQYRCVVDGANGSVYLLHVYIVPAVPVITAGGALNICQGGDVLLSSSAASGNQWFLNGIAITGATGASLLVTQSGTYTVQNGFAPCTSVSAAVVVNVTSLPVTPVISSTGTQICGSNTITLSSSASTGNQWYLNGAPVTGATASTYPAAIGGSYTVKVQENGCTSFVSNTISVVTASVPQTPVITASPSAVICAGNSAVLTAASSGCNGCNYSWTGSATGSGPSLTVNAAGNYQVTVSNSCGTASAAQAVTVVANPVVTVSPNDTTICQGTAITLNATGAITYSWAPNYGLNTTTGATVVASPPSSIAYQVTGITGSCSTTVQRLVLVTPTSTPSVGISYNGCPSSNLQFSALLTNPGNSGFVVEWYVNGVLSGTSQFFTLNNAVNGTQVYAKLYSTVNCASSATATSPVITISCITTAMPYVDGLEFFSVTPNPSNGRAQVQLKLLYGKAVNVTVQDQHGRTVYGKAHNLGAGSNLVPLDLSHLSQGIYYLVMQMDSQRIVEKLVIIK